jgi:hypothetical protein
MLGDYSASLSNILTRISQMDGDNSLEDFWRILEVRSAETAEAWRNHIEQGTDLPQ